jgi:hypothetical protein
VAGDKDSSEYSDLSPRSDLGETEVRLRRLLNLEGQLLLRWSRITQPVTIVGDGTLPGFGNQTLRTFVCQGPTTVAVAAQEGYWFKAQQDLILDKILMYAVGAASFNPLVSYLGSSEADPFAIATAIPTVLLDRGVTSSETGGLLRGAAVVTSGAVLWQPGNSGGGNQYDVPICPFFLPAGAKIWCGTTVAANTCRTFLRGRLF